MIISISHLPPSNSYYVPSVCPSSNFIPAPTTLKSISLISVAHRFVGMRPSTRGWKNLPEITSSKRNACLSPSSYSLPVAPQHLVGIGGLLFPVCWDDWLGFSQINKESVSSRVPWPIQVSKRTLHSIHTPSFGSYILSISSSVFLSLGGVCGY